MNTSSRRVWVRGVVLLVIVAILLAIGTPAKGEGGWKRYRDPDFGFSILFPITWELEIRFENPGRSEEVIRRQIVLTGPGKSQIYLDLWENRSLIPLEQWFADHQQPLLSIGTTLPGATNALVDGVPAFTLSEPETRYKPATILTLWRSPQNAIFRMTYFAVDSGLAQSIYYQMLSGFLNSSVRRGIASVPQLPLAFVDGGLPRGDALCCGYSDPGNPYGCCPYVEPCCGNCVWWAHYRATWLPDVWWGEPSVWPQKARETGFQTGFTPKVGAVVAYTSGDHVAYVEEVNTSTGQYRISEMWWPDGCDHDCCHVCTDNWKTGGEFIYAPDSGCCGCLPANCCSSVDIAQASDLPNTAGRADPNTLSDATLLPGTASSTCQSASIEEPAPIAEEEAESSTLDGPDLLDEDTSSLADAPELEPSDVLPEEPDPFGFPAASASVAQWEAVDPQRTPPTSANYSIAKSVFGSGGGKRVSTNYVMNSTQGQSTDLSHRSSASYRLLPGYWGVSSPHSFYYRVYLPVILRQD